MPNDVCVCGSGRKVKKCHGVALARSMGDPATLDDALDGARPLLIDPDVEGYPLIKSGTCFLFKYRGDVWVASSRHAFTNQRAEFHQARVLASLDEGRPRFLRLAEILEPLDADTEDTAWRDFVLFRSDEPVPRWMRMIDLDGAFASLAGATEEDWVRVCGFPIVLDNGVLYPEKNIRVRRAELDGRYSRATESKFVHEVSFASTGDVTTLNGMSGGPVFFTKQASEPWEFAGLLVSEGTQSRPIARFIEAAALENTLRWHYDANPTATIDPQRRRP